MKNIELENTAGDKVLVNWNNVTHVGMPQNYLMGQVGDMGGCLEVMFTNKRSVHVIETMDEIKMKLSDQMADKQATKEHLDNFLSDSLQETLERKAQQYKKHGFEKQAKKVRAFKKQVREMVGSL